MTPREHLRLLRWSIAGVAVFIFVFSLLFRHTQFIFMFFAVTGAIYLGGAGSVIIGGLYWRRGTTAAAWSAMIVGSVLAVTGFVIAQVAPRFPLTGQEMYFVAMVSSVVVYVLVSLLGRRHVADLDRILHRGRYAVEGQSAVNPPASARGWRLLGIGKDFTRADRAVYLGTSAWTLLWFLVFVGGTAWSAIRGATAESWAEFWYWYVWIAFVCSALSTVWFLMGGCRDLKRMFHKLRRSVPDDADDGRVQESAAASLEVPGALSPGECAPGQ